MFKSQHLDVLTKRAWSPLRVKFECLKLERGYVRHSIRTHNLAQLCDLEYQFSSLTEPFLITMAKDEKAKFVTDRVMGSNHRIGKIRRNFCCLESPTECGVQAESIGKLL